MRYASARVTDHNIPLYQVLSFGSVSAVENYMGVGNHLVSAAKTFFASAPPGSDFLVANAPVGGHRARIFGANNFNTLTLAQIQAIRGTLHFTTQGYRWGPVSVNLSSVTDSCSGKPPNDCYDRAASVLQTQINAAQPTNIATFMGSIAPGSCSYAGSIEGGVMNVTVAPTACVYIGGTVTGGGYSGTVVAQQPRRRSPSAAQRTKRRWRVHRDSAEAKARQH
jgi:hypothetical protein